MTRFAWLQSRTQTTTVAVVLAALAVVAAVTGIQLSHLYSSLILHCQTGCEFATDRFLSHQHFLDHVWRILAQTAPALFGIFWGAPLVARELETGTYRLAWTQSVTRSRWVLTKLCLVGLATITAAGLLTLMITWWERDLDAVGANRYAVFDVRGIVPIGYAVFAFAAGALLGAVLRRSVPAMAATLAVFVFARVAVTLWVRPHLLSPVTRTISLLTADRFGFALFNGGALTIDVRGSGPPQSWTLSTQLVTQSGHPASDAVRTAFLHQYCPSIAVPPSGPESGGITKAPDPAAFDACRAQAARFFHLLVTYQPADRYWTFQWLELGIFVVLAVAAAAGCYWWVTRRAA